MKTITLLASTLFLLHFDLNGQDRNRYILQLNKIIKDYEEVNDEFYPVNNRYVPKTKNMFGFVKSSIYPEIYKNGNIVLKSHHEQNFDWLFVERLVIKTNEGLIEIEAGDCIRETTPAGTKEICTYPIDQALFEKLGTNSDIKVRLYGRHYFKDIEFDSEKWNQHFNLYNLLDKLEKFN